MLPGSYTPMGSSSRLKLDIVFLEAIASRITDLSLFPPGYICAEFYSIEQICMYHADA